MVFGWFTAQIEEGYYNFIYYLDKNNSNWQNGYVRMWVGYDFR